MGEPIRWIATVYYRTRAGLVDIVHDLHEIEDLHDLVEAGPHWDAIHKIDIRRASNTEQLLTVEEAAQL